MSQKRKLRSQENMEAAVQCAGGKGVSGAVCRRGRGYEKLPTFIMSP